MNKELLMVFIPAISWLLFALGGTEISKEIKGKKWIRRFILPCFYILFCIIGGIGWIRSVLIGVLATGTFCLGYGEKKTWLQRIGVGSMYSLISIPIGLSVWNIFTLAGFIGLFYLSNIRRSSSIFIWKIVEGFYGLLVGIQIAYSLLGYSIKVI